MKKECNWGGACLSTILENKIIKLTVEGIELLNLSSENNLWKEITNDLEFTLAKGMIMAVVPEAKEIIICGNSSNYYCLHFNEKEEVSETSETNTETTSTGSPL